jgi:exodeoxyribonuclease-3
MRIASWNVNGIRAVATKGFTESLEKINADVIGLQEIKALREQLGPEITDIPGYKSWFYSAERKGYSGTALYSKIEPKSVEFGFGVEEFDHEGRVITLEYPDFYMITVYVPNSQDGLKRLDYRMRWEDDFLKYIKKLDKKKPVIYCGDLNVAHEEIDLKNPKANHENAGFSDEERGKFSDVLNAGFVDSFRFFYPDTEGAYSWWSYRMKARERNAGWRIDYFVVSDRIKDKMTEAKIHSEILGSDHCPVELDINL